MKRIGLVWLAAFAFGFWPLLAAQERRPGERENQQFEQQQQERERQPQQVERPLRGSQLLDMNVYNRQDEQLAGVEDFIFEGQEERVLYLVLGSGGILGIGRTRYMVPFEAFQFDVARERAVLDITQERFNEAPELEEDWRAAIIDPAKRQRLESFYGMQARATRDPQRGAGQQERQPQATQPQVPAQYFRGSEVIDQNVENLQGERLGRIHDILLDAEKGKLAYAALSTRDDKYIAVPWKAFRHVPERNVFRLDISREALQQMRGFEEDAWPTAPERDWLRPGGGLQEDERRPGDH
jgi:sporulation protein YlmC with PRC-barrel domain